ncbi:MAG: HXXEE domain-containing protein [Pseudomonadota bacterium]
MTFFMASQVVNAIFHLGATIIFQRFSPGLITAILISIPVNILMCQAALREKLVRPTQLIVFFLVGATLFKLFEIFGPFPLLAFVFVTWVWIVYTAPNGTAAAL